MFFEKQRIKKSKGYNSELPIVLINIHVCVRVCIHTYIYIFVCNRKFLKDTQVVIVGWQRASFSQQEQEI